MPFDVQALMHNKPALIGLGVAGAAGLYVLIRRKQTTGSTTSGAGGGTAYTVPSSYPDTTSTDLVQQWGQFSQNLLSDLQQAFPGSGSPNGGTGAITTTTPPTGTTTPTTPVSTTDTSQPSPAYVHTTVHEGEKLSQLLSAFNISQDQFFAINPGLQSTLRSYITGKGYVAAGTPGAVQAFNTGQDVKVNLPPGTPGGW